MSKPYIDPYAAKIVKLFIQNFQVYLTFSGICCFMCVCMSVKDITLWMGKIIYLFSSKTKPFYNYFIDDTFVTMKLNGCLICERLIQIYASRCCKCYFSLTVFIWLWTKNERIREKISLALNEASCMWKLFDWQNEDLNEISSSI